MKYFDSVLVYDPETNEVYRVKTDSDEEDEAIEKMNLYDVHPEWLR
ncbi:MAG: hypothetical protein IJJ44_12635 [Solobacterium sp.]|nr:hypothetical protein [Solobacterium sp.]